MAKKERPKTATVITGVNRTFERPIFSFTADLCEVEPENVDAIIKPRVDIALGWRSGLSLTEREVFQLKDIAHTRAQESWLFGSRSCVIVTRFACRPGTPEFDTCRQFALRQRQEVEGWGLFPHLITAAFTPDGRIVEL